MFVFYNTKDFATITRSTEPTKEENATNEKFKPEKTSTTLFKEIKTKKHGCELYDNEEEKSNTTTDLEALMLEDNNNDIEEIKGHLKRKVRNVWHIL